MNAIAETWLGDGSAIPLPAELSAGFAAYLGTLAWHPSRVDLRRMPPSEYLHLDHIAIWYGERLGGIVVELRAARREIEELFESQEHYHYEAGLCLSVDRDL